MSVITAEHLRSLHQKRKMRDLDITVDLITQEFVVPAAEAGETSTLIKQDSYHPRVGYPIKQRPALADLVNALHQRFPDTIITVGSETTVRDSGVFEKKEHIYMNWS